MKKALENIWVELVGNVIMARIRGAASDAGVRDCQSRLVALLADTGCKRIMYDALELENPSADVAITQQSLTSALADPDLRIAIVVANTKVAYFARLAFGEANHRVFYNDMTTALAWLASTAAAGTMAPFPQQDATGA